MQLGRQSRRWSKPMGGCCVWRTKRSDIYLMRREGVKSLSNVDARSTVHSEIAIDFIHLLHIAFHLTLGSVRVQSHAHVLNAFAEHFLAVVKLLEHELLLFVWHKPRADWTLVHLDLLKTAKRKSRLARVATNSFDLRFNTLLFFFLSVNFPSLPSIL